MLRIISTLLVAYTLVGCTKEETGVSGPELQLTTIEQQDLSYLREEEKLARDVYLYNKELYGLNIFGNISSSEQTHMDKVLELLELAGLEDPMKSNSIGEFNNAELAALYTELTEQSSVSIVEALKVGALIEDLDIDDIEKMMTHTTNTSVLKVYSNLVCGSKNHIRAYTNNIENNGETYTPQFISVDYYNQILSESSGGCGN
jgi:hypothetical protein